jgi:hypothetical protein
MTPQTVNAVNLPMLNGLNFPAAILQAPYFDADADAAANYGGTGGTIGHEISHSFDDQGAQFDSQGRLRNWWTPTDLEHFQKAGAALADCSSTATSRSPTCVNGKQTLSENIADVAGLAAALDAYHASLGGKPAPVIDGLTGDQRFFLAYAQSWRAMRREASSASADHRRPRARPVPRRHRAQPRRLVRRLRHQAGRRAVPAARKAREGLVGEVSLVPGLAPGTPLVREPLMAAIEVDPAHVHEFVDADAFYDWLSRHHDKQSEVWIKIHKVGSGLPSITPKQAIDVVLCWGWIDAVRKGFDDKSFLQRYTPRGKKSIWSQINVDNVARLIAEGRMTSTACARSRRPRPTAAGTAPMAAARA